MNSKIIEFQKIEYIKNSIVTIGKFNGVHLGHQKLIKYMVDKARLLNMTSVVITFKMKGKSIYEFNYNIDLIKKLGVNYIVVIDFSSKFYKMDYREFFYKVIDYYDTKEIVVGADFAFGYNREGDTSSLRLLCNKENIDVVTFPFLMYENEKISSSNIKEYIENGDVEIASVLLGRIYSYMSIVEKGNHLGNTISFPTANSALLDNVVLPKSGVYYSTSTVEGQDKYYISMTCVGRTSLNGAMKFETYILDYNSDIYGKKIEVRLYCYSRDNIVIKNFEELKIVLEQDKINTYQYFNRRKI